MRDLHGMLLCVFGFTLVESQAVAESKVYALFAIDTDLVGYDDDGSESEEATRILRSAARHNRDMILAAFVESFNIEGRRHRLEYKILEGRQVTWKNIHGFWDTVESDDDDIYVFYYFGHGAVDSELGHYFALTHAATDGEFGGAPCYRCYLRAAMQAKPNRLCVLLTDCCSSYIDGTGGLTRVAEGANWDVMAQLMFGPTGMVDVTAAQPGTVARATEGGGFFTESLVHHLCGPLEEAEVDIDGELSWSEFLGSVRHRVDVVHEQPQSQHNFYLNEWGERRFERELRIENNSSYDLDVFVQYYAYNSDLEAWDWYGSQFYDTGRPTESSKRWTVRAGDSTRLRDGDEYLIRGDTIVTYAEAPSANLFWQRRETDCVYGDYGYISDDGRLGTTTVRFD